MRLIPMFLVALFSTLVQTTHQAAYAQSFSCAIGEPACLDYGAKVCSHLSKCVADDAICFDTYTCDFNGFVCKSTLNDAVRKNRELLDDYNDLVGRVNYLNDCLDRAENMEDVGRCQRKY